MRECVETFVITAPDFQENTYMYPYVQIHVFNPMLPALMLKTKQL